MRATHLALPALLLAATALGAAERGVAFRFRKDDVGKLPAGWKAERTGKGGGSVWKLTADETAPSGAGVVLTQTAESPNAVFNLCVAAAPSRRDVELRVSFKALRG